MRGTTHHGEHIILEWPQRLNQPVSISREALKKTGMVIGTGTSANKEIKLDYPKSISNEKKPEAFLSL